MKPETFRKFPEPAAFRPGLVSFEGDLAPVRDVIADIAAAGGRALLVGGCVRDALLGHASKDMDIEVHNLSADALRPVLARRHSIITVGQSFGVFKLRGLDVDVSLPRRESKNGVGHRGFAVWGDPRMSLREAASRRDFTINAVYWDPATGALLDPCGGLRDLESRILRHTSPSFADDPLRVLRAMQFLARFQFSPAPETVALCRSIDPENLPAERIFEEWLKLILKGEKPSLGLGFLRECGWVRHYPELEALIGVPQDPEWHPEGDVWAHTAFCLDAFAARRMGDRVEDTVVGLAVLCHDFGKALTTRRESDGRWHAYGHEMAGVAPARAFIERMTRQRDIVESVLPLVECHMRPLELWRANAGNGAIRRLARKVGRIDRLIRVDEADRNGRPPLSPGPSPQGAWLAGKAAQLQVQASVPSPILKGRHLIARGIEPSPRFREILDQAFEAQLDGEITDLDSALSWLARQGV
ncbi:MAG: HD domain-containing protein [Puniceicoccales bacterium]|jgi:tRNA nucleotidyltransferase (CCA-adding enzyme)|nr:HD domain-containing protein [Puniceicoccales bacterium]